MGDGAAIFGFNPDAGGRAAWQVVYGLRNGDAFPGIVTDDAPIFTAARQHSLAVEAFDVLLPEPACQFFVAALNNEKQLRSRAKINYRVLLMRGCISCGGINTNPVSYFGAAPKSVFVWFS